MEVAVNPQLQSAVLDKFARPFADKTRQITENLDLSVEKQDVVIEKQDKLGDKVKDVVSNLEGAGGNFSDAFSRSSDGLKELSMGFVDIKGIIEEVGKKFSALQDFLSPLAEVLSFLFVSGFFGKKKDKNEGIKKTSMFDRLKERGQNIVDKTRAIGTQYRKGELLRNKKDGTLVQPGQAEDPLLLFKEKITKTFSNFGDKFKNLGKSMAGFTKNLLAAARGFGLLIVGMLPVIAKFLLIGGLIAVAAVGIGKLIKALGGWELLEKGINGIINLVGRIQNGFRQFILAIDTAVRKISFGTMSILSDDERASKQKAIEDTRDARFFRNERSAGNVPEGATIENGKILDADGNTVAVRKGTEAYEQRQEDVSKQQELDVLALESVKRLPQLQKMKDNARNDKQREHAEKAIAAAEHFIVEYNKSNEVSAQDRFAQLQQEKGTNVFGKQKEVSLKDVVKSVEEQYGVEIEGNTALKASQMINNASKSGNVIAEQTAESKTASDSSSSVTSVMQPSVIQNNSSTFEMSSQPAFEGINP
jgi:hypothetical protein